MSIIEQQQSVGCAPAGGSAGPHRYSAVHGCLCQPLDPVRDFLAECSNAVEEIAGDRGPHRHGQSIEPCEHVEQGVPRSSGVRHHDEPYLVEDHSV